MEENLCKSYNRKGKPCGNHPYGGTGYCYLHSFSHSKGLVFFKRPWVHVCAVITFLIIIACVVFLLGPFKGTVRQNAFFVHHLKSQLDELNSLHSPEWLQKYPVGYALIGIIDKQIVIPSRSSRLNSQYSLDWSNARVLDINQYHVRLIGPDIIDSIHGITYIKNEIELSRSWRVQPLYLEGSVTVHFPSSLDMCYGLIDDNGLELTVMLGFRNRIP